MSIFLQDGGCSHIHDFVIMHIYETATKISICASSAQFLLDMVNMQYIFDSVAITTPSKQISQSQTQM